MSIRFLPRGSSPSARRVVLWLIGGTVLLNAAMVALTAVALHQSRKGHEERAATASRNLTALLERDLLATIQKIDFGLLSVIDEDMRAPRRAAGNEAAFDALVDRQSSRIPEAKGMMTTDAAGNTQTATAIQREGAFNIAGRDYFQRLRTTPDPSLLICQPQMVSLVSGRPEMIFARRLQTPAGAFDGIVLLSIDMQRLTDMFRTLEIGPHGVVWLRDDSQTVIARHSRTSMRPEDVRLGGAQVRAFVQAGQTDSTYYSPGGPGGLSRISSFTQIGHYPLYAGVGLAMEDVLADWHGEFRKAIAFALIFMTTTGLGATLLWNAWRRRDANLQALRAQERKFRTLVESSPDPLVITDAHDTIAMVNRQTEVMFDYAPGQLVGRPLTVLVLGLPDVAASLTPNESRSAGLGSVDRWAVTRSGHEFPVSISLSRIDTDEGGMVVASIRDVTERRANEERIAFLAHHDALTGLPNRIVMQSRFEQAAAQADRSQTKLALLFLDLDNFKTINDSLGHQVGDAVLRSVAERLRDGTRDIDTISRQGGDEFLLMFAQLPDAETARLMVQRLVERFRVPCVVDGRAITTPFSIGIALYPDDGADFGTLQKNADIAMYQAKAAGRNIHRFFSERMNVEAVENMLLREGLHAALERREFVLHYQPQIELATGRVVGVEALVRWQHPEQGLIGPNRFIPAAEASGLIVPIGEWVLNEACRQARAWLDAGLPPMLVAVNMSAVQFARGDVEATVRGALKAAGLAPSSLELELTESILIQDVDSVLATVQALKRLGVKLSIDDFGTGYSSLSYLTRFAFDKLKIDRSFISGLSGDAGHAAIVRAIVQMARGLGLKTIAEGVEDASTCDRLLDFGCDEAQGYLFARPLTPDALQASIGALALRAPQRATAHEDAVGVSA